MFTLSLHSGSMLARLRSYGPAFDYELKAENGVAEPHACAGELLANGFHVDVLRRFEPSGRGAGRWVTLFVLRIKRKDTGEVIAAPLPVGVCGYVEQWPNPSTGG